MACEFEITELKVFINLTCSKNICHATKGMAMSCIAGIVSKLESLQEELDKHTKYEGGVSMDCGHPVQCAYACAKVDGGPVRCFVCDLETERDKYKEYSYYVGGEQMANRIPKKYCKWLSERS